MSDNAVRNSWLEKGLKMMFICFNVDFLALFQHLNFKKLLYSCYFVFALSRAHDQVWIGQRTINYWQGF